MGLADIDSVLYAPLMLDGQPVGLLGLGNKPGGFTRRDDRMAEAFAEIVSVALREHRTREELRASLERHRALFDSSADALMTLGPPSWCFTSGNSSAVKLFGAADAEDFTSRAPWDYSPAEQPDGTPSREKAEEMTRIALERGSHLFPWRHRSLDGREFPATVLLAPMKIHGQMQLQATVRDETERHALQAQVAQSDRLASMGMLAAGVAHEINNPLAYMLYNLESLTEDMPALAAALHRCRAAMEQLRPGSWEEALGKHRELLNSVALEDMEERIRDALHGTRRIKQIARGLGTFSRVDEERLVPVDLMHVMETAANMVHNEIKYRARLVKDYGKISPVVANDGKLSQVFLNLLVNAAHAVDDGEVDDNVIRLRTWQEGEEVFAEVADTGKGIAAEHMERLFDPFFTTKELGVGTGIGLSISKNIVEQLNGTIEVTSEVGRGTRFVVRLPVKGREPTGDDLTSVELDFADEPRGRILLVDDESAIRIALRRILGRHEVVEMAGGREAMELLERDRNFDVVLCDVMMPEVSGLDLHSWLASLDPALADQLIFITGGAFTPRTREYLARVNNLRLEKPFDVKNLVRIVADRVKAARG